MISTKCPFCSRAKLTVSEKGSHGALRRIRTHHEPTEVDLNLRIRGPLCRGSKFLVDLEKCSYAWA